MTEYPYNPDYFRRMRSNPYIIYVENFYNKDINDFANMDDDGAGQAMTVLFSVDNIGFVYPPYLLRDKNFLEMLDYNRPYLINVLSKVTAEDIYAYLFKERGLDDEESSYLLDLTGEYLTEAVPLITFTDYMKAFKHVSKEINRIREEEKEREALSNRHKKWEVEEIPAPIDLALALEESKTYYEQYQQLSDEILQRIETLKEFGAFTILADIIEEITAISNPLSSLLITDEYRIYLKDYQMKEIKMRPIEKALYLLYLKHPEGINFKELINHEEELLYIYREVSQREDVDRMRQTIAALTDPSNNSINEKVSRIRTAFISQVTDKLANNYYISGSRGADKSITLDRSLVIYE